MRRARRAAAGPFGSAVIGGAVVAAFGWIAIAAGWIHSDSSSGPSSPAPLTAPVVSRGGAGDPNIVNEIYRHDGRGVAFIEADQPAEVSPFSPFVEPEGGGIATGSGFVIDHEGHLLTNNHVVEGASHIRVKIGSSDRTYEAKVEGSDPATDIALLKVDVSGDRLAPLPLGDSAKVRVGDPVVAIGNPFGLDRTVTSGIVSALQRQIQAPNGFSISHVIQTDAAINPGNSGGPLIDASGRVIGINSQIETGGGSSGNVGIGFAIPINTAREVVRQIEQNGKVQHAFLGISGISITPDLARAVNLPAEEGVLVQEVVRGGPADKAGIEGGTTSATLNGTNLTLGGDIISKIDGRRVSGMEDVINIVNGASPGDSLEVTVLRRGSTKTVTVALGSRPASAQPGPDAGSR